MDKQQQMRQLQQELEAAVSQLPLAETAQDIVHGEGDVNARILLIGEAPGYHESVQRRPFVGRSGQLLRSVLTEVDIPPETVWISNIVKARPPDNRDPSPAEIAAYRSYLNQEIGLINPELIVTLGRFSMAKFLPDVRISQVHGRLHKVTWEGQQLFVLPMYHPAAALRSTQMKTSFMSDFQKVDKVLTWIAEQNAVAAFSETVNQALS